MSSPFVFEVKAIYDSDITIDERAIKEIVRNHKEQMNQEAIDSLKNVPPNIKTK
jgi:hypothetical protein